MSPADHSLTGVASAYFQNGIPLPPCPIGTSNYSDVDRVFQFLNTTNPTNAAYVELARAAEVYQSTGGRCVSVKGLPDVRLAVTYIILYTSLCTVLFMLLTTILLKGGLESAKRRSLIVWLLAASILLGLVASIFDTAFWTVQMVNAHIPSSAYDGLYIVEDLMLFLVPWVVSWALIMRLAMFWPAALFGRRKQFLVILPPSILQCVTLACYVVVLQIVHSVDHMDEDNVPWNETALTVLGQTTEIDRMRWDHSHYATTIAVLLYVNLGLSRQWLRMRSSRGNGVLAQMRRWIGLGPDPILRLAPSRPDPEPTAARLEDAKLLRTLRPQRRVGVWWTIVRTLHFIAFGFWVPTAITCASWAVLSTQKLEVSMYLGVALMYVFPVAGIVACLGATSRFFDRENHYYPSQTNVCTPTNTFHRDTGTCATDGTDDLDLEAQVHGHHPEMYSGDISSVSFPPNARRRATHPSQDLMSLSGFLSQGPGPSGGAAAQPQGTRQAPVFRTTPFVPPSPVQANPYDRRPSAAPLSKIVNDCSVSDG